MSRFQKISLCSILFCCLLLWPSHAIATQDTATNSITDSITDSIEESSEELQLEEEELIPQPLSLLPYLSSELPLSSAAAAVVLEAQSGQLLFSHNGSSALPPASCTKILTALLTLDMADTTEITTVSASAAAVGESSIYLREGEQLSLSDLLQGALVHSGNDACFALAEATAGSEPLFIHWLNLKAALLGAYSCQFRNSNGLPDDEHLISAADLALLTAQAMDNDFFAQTVSSKYVNFGKNGSYRSYKNTNKLLWQDSHIIGVKTGTTNDAGPCLVAAYQDGAAQFISVVFNSTDRYGESMRLLRWAAANFCLLQPISAGQLVAYTPQHGLLAAADDVCLLLPEDERDGITVRWELPQRVCFFTASGKEIASCDLIPAGKSMASGE